MDIQHFPQSLITAMQGLPPDILWIPELLLCFGAIVMMHRLFGEAGLYVYIALAVIGANIQVLKAVQFTVFPEPVALGTILFSSTYLATDILAERYGASSAQRGVWLGFVAFLLFTLLMLLTLGFAPLTPEQAGADMSWNLPYQDYMAALFTPQLTFFVAGMVAYLVSQSHDVWLFDWLKRKSDGRFIWLRNNVSTMLSALIDNTVFSVLAWIVLTSNPLPFSTVLFTYILGTYILRVVVALLDTPFIYLACKWKPVTA